MICDVNRNVKLNQRYAFLLFFKGLRPAFPRYFAYDFSRKVFLMLYRKIPLIFGRGSRIREEKHFSLQSVKLITFLSFFQIL